ncbi:MAG: hypothetical protein JZU63_05235, partial [Rhodoferax sp.]|nr:hypothetical protein [Rhodoferax sp.]
VEDLNIHLAGDGVVVCNGTQYDGEFNQPEDQGKPRDIYLPSSIMNEEAAAAENGVGIEVHHGLQQMWGLGS